MLVLFKRWIGALCMLLTCPLWSQFSFAEPSVSTHLTLEHTLKRIKQNSFALKQFKVKSQAYESESSAANYLPDPSVFAAIQSLPTDTFDLDQEPMTQLRFGLRQMFPKGDTLEINADISSLKSDQQHIAQTEHWLSLKKMAEQTWLEAWFWQKKGLLLQDDKVFLNQIVDFTRSLYEVGAKDQSDLIGAELQLMTLNERSIEALRKYNLKRQQLNVLANSQLVGQALSDQLPSLALAAMPYETMPVESIFAKHPRIAKLNNDITIAERNTQLVEQDMEPAWGMEVSYGLRDGQNMDGSERADFFSAGLSVQLPLFSQQKQHKNQLAAKQRTGLVMLERDEALSDLRFQYQSLQLQYQNTREQRVLYETEILPTLARQKQRALQSYESDKSDLSKVLDIFLKAQRATTMHQRLLVNEQQHLSSLNFLIGLDNGALNE